MKIFERNAKMNFVDRNNVFVGFDYSQCCCEQFGYKLSRKFLYNDILGHVQKQISTVGYNFDTTYCEAVTDAGQFECGGAAVFRLVKDDKELFLTIWNNHNGYYAHGFDMCNGETVLYSGHL